MKRTISSAVLGKKPARDASAQEERDNDVPAAEALPLQSEPTSGIKPRMGGSGSAWKAGALNDTQVLLNEKRAEVVQNILEGCHVLELSAEQVTDEIGTDRRDDWMDQEAFRSLFESIQQNGQDTPIQVWPVDPNWTPDDLDPENVKGTDFYLITGRRRHAIARQLDRPVKAVLASRAKRGASDDQFEMLFMRFRENEERENLGAFERLLSVGEMFDRYTTAKPDEKITAVAFAKKIGVHESHVSRGKAVLNARDEILHVCKNVYSLSHRELEKVVASLSEKPARKEKKTQKPQKLVVVRTIAGQKLSVAAQGGRLSVSTAGMDLDKKSLEGLSDVIASYLQEHGSKK